MTERLADVSAVLQAIAEVVVEPGAGPYLRERAAGGTEPAEPLVLLLAALAERQNACDLLTDGENIVLATRIARAVVDYLAERDQVQSATRATRHTMATD